MGVLSKEVEREFVRLRADFKDLLSLWQLGNRTKYRLPKLTSWTLNDGYKNLLLSLPSASISGVNTRSILENGVWNPHSQRIAMPSNEYSALAFGTFFVDVQKAFTVAALLKHEALHIALWEPFFVGRYNINTSAEFHEACLAFEAVCYFDTDIIQTKKIRAKFKHGEPIFSRIAVSQNTFHPDLAFKEMGFREEKKILDFYLQTFLNDKSTSEVDGLFSKSLLHKLMAFRFEARMDLECLYRQFTKIGVFGEFKERFCIRGLPELYANDIGNISEFSKNYEQLISGMDSISPKVLLQVRARRALQMRAYFALHLKAAIRAGSLSKSKSAFDLPLHKYLDGLEALLSQLESKHFWALLQTLDTFWEKEIREPAKKSDVYLIERDLIIPSLEIAKIDLRKNTTKENRLKIWSMLMKRLLKDDLRKNTKSYRQICVQLNKLQGASETEFKKIMLSPEIAKLWTIRLDQSSPRSNRFDEFLFQYE